MMGSMCVSLVKDPFPKSVTFHPLSLYNVFFFFLFQSIKIFNSLFFLSDQFIKFIRMAVQTTLSI